MIPLSLHFALALILVEREARLLANVQDNCPGPYLESYPLYTCFRNVEIRLKKTLRSSMPLSGIMATRQPGSSVSLSPASNTKEQTCELENMFNRQLNTLRYDYRQSGMMEGV